MWEPQLLTVLLASTCPETNECKGTSGRFLDATVLLTCGADEEYIHVVEVTYMVSKLVAVNLTEACYFLNILSGNLFKVQLYISVYI
jgi:hypothetical protein